MDMEEITVVPGIDIHTHILPGIDDGSRTPEISLKMLECEYDCGVETVVLTPHFYPSHDTPEHFLRNREKSFEKLRSVLISYPMELPKLVLGSEVMYFEGMSYSEELNKLCISGTNMLLTELPCGHWSERIPYELERIKEKRGITPIIAHIDRYMEFSLPYKSLFELDVFIQANIEALTRWRTSGKLFKMLKNEQIAFLASDCHNMDTRAPEWEKALKKLNAGRNSWKLAELFINSERLLADANYVNIS